MKKMNTMEMRSVEGGAQYTTSYANGRCYVRVTCPSCGCMYTFNSKIILGYKAGAKNKATNAANNWLYNHGCWN